MLKPDVTYVHDRKRPVKGWQSVVPDLVVEVVSPNDRVEDLELKLADFRAAGVPLIWIIHPATQTAQVVTLNSRSEIARDGSLDGGEILPGFTLSLAELFSELEG